MRYVNYQFFHAHGIAVMNGHVGTGEDSGWSITPITQNTENLIRLGNPWDSVPLGDEFIVRDDDFGPDINYSEIKDSATLSYLEREGRNLENTVHERRKQQFLMLSEYFEKNKNAMPHSRREQYREMLLSFSSDNEKICTNDKDFEM